LKNFQHHARKECVFFSSHPENSFYVGAGDAWQVERSKFDQMMLHEALQRGAACVHGKVSNIHHEDNLWTVSVQTDEGHQQLSSCFVIDASGQQRFTQKKGFWGTLQDGDYAHQIAFFGHFKGVQRQAVDMHDTLIFHRKNHEWAWMIPLSTSMTSIGLVVPVAEFKKRTLSINDYINEQLQSFSEPLQQRISRISISNDIQAVSNYSFSIENYAQNGLFCVGDSHRFIDPIFSFGVQFAVVEEEYVSQAIVDCAQSDASRCQLIHEHYMAVTTQAQDVIQDMLSYFWKHPWGFENMAHHRYADEFLEIFAGRIYEKKAGAGLLRMREVLTRMVHESP